MKKDHIDVGTGHGGQLAVAGLHPELHRRGPGKVMKGRPGALRWFATGLALAALAMVPTACGGGGHASSTTTTTRAGY